MPKTTVQAVAREQIRQGVSRSAAVDALVLRGIPRDTARVAVDNAIQKSAGSSISGSTVKILLGLGMIGLGILLSVLAGNVLFYGLMVVGAITAFKGLIGAGSDD